MRTRTIFYVYVGNLPRAKAIEHLKSVREDFGSQLIKIPGDELIYLPILEGQSRVEVLVYPQD